jgi:hypothetical protein
MDSNVRAMYLRLVGDGNTPKQIFNAWNRIKMTCANENIIFTQSNKYPKFVRMIMRYRTK